MVIDLKEKFGLFAAYWSPRILGEVNDAYVKAAKFKGEFTWHKHDHEDELLMVIQGAMTVQFRDHNEEVGEGQFIIVPKGVEHCPMAAEEAHILLLEPKTTLNTGDVVNEKTVADLEWI